MPPETGRPRETALRLASYRPFMDEGWAHAASLGIRLLELHLPRDAAESERYRERLTEHRLRVTSFQGRIDFAAGDFAAQFEPQFETMATFDCRRMLLAFPPPDLPTERICAALAEVAGHAARDDITLMLETHPDLFHNTAVARTTLGRIGHPAARINFDPANVLFYNETQLDPVAELRGLGSQVAGIHLKDTPGGYGVRHFAELGSGVIDFPGLYETLAAIGYEGPCTLEIEGIAGEEPTRDVVLGRVEASLAYLRDVVGVG